MISLFLYFVAFALTLNISYAAGATEVSAVPISRFQGKECGLNVKSTSYIFCDQDNLLKANDKEEILETIGNTAEELGLKFSVIVLNKMNTTGIQGDAASYFASKLYKTQAMDGLGLLIFISVKDKKIVLERGKLFVDLLPDAEIASIVKSYKGKRPVDAIKGSVKKVLSYLDNAEAKEKLMARRWSLSTWTLAISSAIATFTISYGVLLLLSS